MMENLLFILLTSIIHVSTEKEDCPENGCEKGWKLFVRPSGGWCIKIFYEENIKKPDAEKKCEDLKAKLSGFQDQRESLYVAYTATNHIAPAAGSIWIGTKRKDACLGEQAKKCSRFNTFEWTDNSTTGVDGFLWGASQPDNSGKNQNCVVLQVATSAFASGFQTATLDDIKCDYEFMKNGKRHPRTPVGYVCGKKAAF